MFCSCHISQFLKLVHLFISKIFQAVSLQVFQSNLWSIKNSFVVSVKKVCATDGPTVYDTTCCYAVALQMVFSFLVE